MTLQTEARCTGRTKQVWCVDAVDLKSKREDEEDEQQPNMLGNANQEDHEVLVLMA